ncbi:hypothetical protein AB6B38_07455 [Glycocaulis abyssi]|uniref:Uncharacterized protein n=1 Tax=Glycocaulis abyssi TaxID=1433403 RepID=A0ABV9NHF0_9PROT
MPSYIDTQSLYALDEAELRALYEIIYAEMLAMPEGSPARSDAHALLNRIRNMIFAKRRTRHFSPSL